VIHTLSEFENIWGPEVEATQKIFKHLTTKSLSQAVASEHRTLGRLAWHIVISISEMVQRMDLTIQGPDPEAPVPETAKDIFGAYDEAALSLLDRIKKEWTDATLQVEDDMYGQRWKRDFTLQALVFHQIHHRAQMTVLMRQAGLVVPGIYGPSRDEWAAFGQQPPAV
jgi:uncharacterized damage-inducible protein DinB